MKKIFGWILIVSVFLVTCQTTKMLKTPALHYFQDLPIRWRYTCDFPEEHKPVVKKAFFYWQKTLGLSQPLFWEDSKCGIAPLITGNKQGGIGILTSPHQEYRINSQKEKAELWAVAPLDFNRQKLKAGFIVLFPVWLKLADTQVQESVIRHEIGHLLGLEHHHDRACLMYESINRDSGLKDACEDEIQQLQKLYINERKIEMGSLERKFARKQLRREYKEHKKTYLKERCLQEKLDREGVKMEFDLLNTRFLPFAGWLEKRQKALKAQAKGPETHLEEQIDLNWEEEALDNPTEPVLE